MTQTQERTTFQPAIVRSEQLVDRVGHNIGSFAALTRQRFQQTVTGIGRGIESTAQSNVAQGEQPNQAEGQQLGRMPQAEMQRAEGLVDQTGQRLSLLTSRIGLQMRKMVAYAREGAEDMWVEAQHIRSTRGGK